MGAVASVTAFFSAIVLGLSAGALLAEGGLLVPFWRSLPPESFLGWYREHASILQRFFGPLQIAAFALAAVAAALRWFVRGSASPFLVLAALLAFAVLVAFPLYFERVNASFAAGTIAPDLVPEELRRWSSWHWVRTIIATAAFVAGVTALLVRQNRGVSEVFRA
jgi:hypothetical protein